MDIVTINPESEDIRSLIHMIRDKQVMIDSDLARLYE